MEVNSKSYQAIVAIKEFLFTQKSNVKVCGSVFEFHIL